jgi:tRNA (adenine37-N6)-methyltransferase
MESVVMHPIGIVESSVREALDDCWGGVISTIKLDEVRFSSESLRGLEAFSHVEIIFFFSHVAENEVLTGAKHPRERTDWPSVGVFAQRVKSRPNRIGLTTCRLVEVLATSIRVAELDAIDGTPILDIKPYIAEFGPRSPTHQPRWATELMATYFGNGG